MKKIFKFTLLIAFALVTQNQFWQNLSFNSGISTIIKVSMILAIFELIIKPIIKLLLLPINLLTLGGIRLIINTLGFYLAEFLLFDFNIGKINTNGFPFLGFNIPPIDLQGFWAHLANSITLSILLFIFNRILYKKN